MLPVGLERAPMSRAGCSCRWLQRHHFDSISFISRLLGAANHGFPVVNPIDPKLASHAMDDIFVTKLNPAGSALVYSTYLGGGSTDDPYAITVDSSGNAYITGRTNSSDFP